MSVSSKLFHKCPVHCVPIQVRSKDDGRHYAVKRSTEKFRGEMDRCVSWLLTLYIRMYI